MRRCRASIPSNILIALLFASKTCSIYLPTSRYHSSEPMGQCLDFSVGTAGTSLGHSAVPNGGLTITASMEEKGGRTQDELFRFREGFSPEMHTPNVFGEEGNNLANFGLTLPTPDWYSHQSLYPSCFPQEGLEKLHRITSEEGKNTDALFPAHHA